MNVLEIAVAPDHTTLRFGDVSFVAPLGGATLAADVIRSDPPRPEELTNAIGAVVDHLDDLVRDCPDVLGAPVRVGGDVVREIAAVEVGREPELPMTLTRAAVEDVFRTVATETHAQRSRNPGLSAAMVRTVVGGCCVVVGVMRKLQLDEIEVVA